jgi:hypothetical protein
MALDLSSVEAKLKWAEHYIDALKSEVSAYIESGSLGMPQTMSEDRSHHRFIAFIQKEPPKVRWSLMVGDAMHNLRCALDHLVYAIAVHESGQNPPPREKTLVFPLCETAQIFSENDNRIRSPISCSLHLR